MWRTIAFLVFAAFQGAHAQVDCIPDNVGNVTLDLNYTLAWEPSTNCDDVGYMIYVHIDDDLRYIYNTSDTFLNVSFLPRCVTFYFEVRAYSGYQLGDESHLDANIPVGDVANLAIYNFTATTENITLFLAWEIDEQFANCSRGFLVTIRDQGDWPKDYIAPNNYYSINSFVPCAQYEIGVRAISSEVDNGPIHSDTYTCSAAPYERPVLQSVSPGPTYVNMTWSVDTYSVNRCPLTSIIVDAPPYFSNLSFPAADSHQRPPISISVGTFLPDRLYTLKIFAANTYGLSPGFPIAVHTTPLDAN